MRERSSFSAAECPSCWTEPSWVPSARAPAPLNKTLRWPRRRSLHLVASHNFKRKADMKAARMHEYGKVLVLEDVPVPEIRPDEVLVQVRACGMCRSDVQLIDGYFRKYADIPTPITPGHEITGVVHKFGELVPKSVGYREGDHVVVAPG